MREALALFAAGLIALLVESAAMQHLPALLVPELSLLFPVAAALLLAPVPGILVAVGLGFGADMLSGALFGQHAFLRLVEFTAVRGLAGQLDLRRPLPLAAFGLGVAALDAAASAGVTRFFLGSFPVSGSELVRVACRALATALAAPAVIAAARSASAWGSLDEARREMRLDTKRPML
jgi:rod shape-determining protein MreD